MLVVTATRQYELEPLAPLSSVLFETQPEHLRQLAIKNAELSYKHVGECGDCTCTHRYGEPIFVLTIGRMAWYRCESCLYGEWEYNSPADMDANIDGMSENDWIDLIES